MSDLAHGVARWFAEIRGVDVAAEDAPAEGRSAQLCFVRAGDDRYAVRTAPVGDPLFPDADLSREVAVMRAAAAGGVPVPEPVALVEDPSWIGRSFVVLPRVEGRHVGEVATSAPWLVDAPVEDQRRLHESFLDALVAVHRVPTDGLPLRRAGLAEEVAWWRSYAEWAGGGSALVDLFDLCAAALPSSEPPVGLLWGDVRLGNVVVDDGFGIAGVLDWEMASIGPAELDVAWFTALSALTERFVGSRVQGFLEHDELVAAYEARLGRPLLDLDWHERFAVARSTAVLVRSEGPGVDVDAHPMVAFATRRMRPR